MQDENSRMQEIKYVTMCTTKKQEVPPKTKAQSRTGRDTELDKTRTPNEQEGRSANNGEA